MKKVQRYFLDYEFSKNDQAIKIKNQNSIKIILNDKKNYQMNKFFYERREDVHVLPSSFAYPEVFATYCNFEPKIVHLAKENSKYHA